MRPTLKKGSILPQFDHVTTRVNAANVGSSVGEDLSSDSSFFHSEMKLLCCLSVFHLVATSVPVHCPALLGLSLSASHVPLFTCPHNETSNWITMADRQVFQTLGTQLLFHLLNCLSPTLNKKVQTIKSIKTFCFLSALGFKSVAGRHITGSIFYTSLSPLNITVMLSFTSALSSSHYNLITFFIGSNTT